MLLGESARSLRMRRVVALDALCASGRLLQRRKRQQPLATRVARREASVLHERGLARRQITHGAVTEPTAVGLDVDALSHRALSRGGLDVATKLIGRARYHLRVDDSPAVLVEQ